MEVIVVHTLGEAIITLEELEMRDMRYQMEKVYNANICETHPYKVAWVIAYEHGIGTDNIPEEAFEE